MPPAPSRPNLSPEFRASLFHSTVFLSNGVLAAYFPIWMSDKGLSAEQIGIVNAAPILILLLASMFIGRIADRASDWRVAIIALAVTAGVASLGFLGANGFWAVLVFFTLCAVPVTALVPILDAATMRMTARRGTHFSAIRVWGTVGYILAAVAAGLAIGLFGAAAFVPIFIACCVVRAIVAFVLPRFRAPEPLDTTLTPPHASGLRDLLQPWFLLPCIAFALISATLYFLGFMGGLIWRADGIPEAYFGPLVAASAVGEAVLMFLWPRLNLRISARMMLIIAGAVAIVRFVGMALVPSLPVLFALQLLHAIMYPFAYFGLMHFVATWTREEHAAEAQSFASMLTQGFTVATFLTFGPLVAAIGGNTFFVAAGMCALACILTAVSIRLMPSHNKPAA